MQSRRVLSIYCDVLVTVYTSMYSYILVYTRGTGLSHWHITVYTLLRLAIPCLDQYIIVYPFIYKCHRIMYDYIEFSIERVDTRA
jgi:hypothetical protein